MIYSGALREKLDFYRIVEIQSESGYKSQEEEYMFTVRAERTRNKETYLVNADELFNFNEHTFRIRYRKEIEETNIVVYEGDKYRITSLDKYMPENQYIINIEKINE